MRTTHTPLAEGRVKDQCLKKKRKLRNKEAEGESTMGLSPI
jgi:hypothetical protein|tara:strand:- start:15 stop:137 length:123 start_codon:yes stop_codon:yes gene_type:complete